jgi:hypothetical protein
MRSEKVNQITAPQAAPCLDWHTYDMYAAYNLHKRAQRYRDAEGRTYHKTVHWRRRQVEINSCGCLRLKTRLLHVIYEDHLALTVRRSPPQPALLLLCGFQEPPSKGSLQTLLGRSTSADPPAPRQADHTLRSQSAASHLHNITMFLVFIIYELLPWFRDIMREAPLQT